MSTALPQPSKQRMIVGWLILTSAILFLVSQWLPVSPVIPALFSWLSVGLFWTALGRSAQRQAAILLIIGILLIVWSLGLGASPDWVKLASRNMPLLTMFVAVSLLSLANPTEEAKQLPRGKSGFWSTLLSSHILGAVINLSIVFVVGDRLLRNGRLSDSQIQVLMRSFCAAAFWSPFFVATGVALTYAPGAEWKQAFIPGLLMVIPMMLINYRDTRLAKFSEFEGYPLKKDSLIMPLVLAVGVLVTHEIYPDISILTIITVLAPMGALIFMKGRPRKEILLNYFNEKQANVSSQFALFLAAGVFSTGISTVISCYPELMQLEIASFSPLMFIICSAIMIGFALVGVHPVVTVAIASPFLIPLGANPNQLAFLFLTVWGIATASSPLSGVGLAMISRYQATPKQILKLQWHYMVLMWLSSGLINWLWFA
ncbi:hypothetical protein ACXJY6_10915 [Vibrio sp. RC27]